MGTICIFLGLILFIGSLIGGFACARVAVQALPTLQATFTALSLPQSASTYYIIFLAIFGFIGLLLCLNLVMHGLTYNKVVKLIKMHRH